MLLDTCILIDVLRNRPNAASYVKSLATPPSISVVTLTELYAGARGERENADINDLRSVLRLFEVTEVLAERAGLLAKRFRASHGLDPIDAIIAATALEEQLPLATLNLKHFPMFPGLARPY